MTREEAIKWLKKEAYYIEEDIGNGKEILESYDMAIEALEQQPCEDCISRQAVISIIDCHKNMDGNDAIVWIEKEIGELPSVTPQPKIGRWIEVIDKIDRLGNRTWHHKCSICENEDSGWGEYMYCPNCGARMEAEE